MAVAGLRRLLSRRLSSPKLLLSPVSHPMGLRHPRLPSVFPLQAPTLAALRLFTVLQLFQRPGHLPVVWVYHVSPLASDMRPSSCGALSDDRCCCSWYCTHAWETAGGFGRSCRRADPLQCCLCVVKVQKYQAWTYCLRAVFGR